MTALGVQTLQTTCFFKLVNELYDFTPEAILAQLPSTLRRMLLLKLPVVDIIKLEGTCVVSGIDMNRVWEMVCNERFDHPLMLSDFPFKRSSFHFEGSWKEHYLAIVSSIILNLVEAEHDLFINSAEDVSSLLFSYCNFRTYARPIPNVPYPEYLLFIPERYAELKDSLETPSNFASFLMAECHYRPKLVYISCSLFFYSPFVKNKDSLEVRDTLIEFLSNTRQIVFSSDDDEVMKYWEPDDDRRWEDRTYFPRVSFYVMDIALCSNDPKLESILTDDKCSVWMAQHIIDAICVTVQSNGSQVDSIFPKERLLKNLPYKNLKSLSFSMNISDPLEEMDEYTAQNLASAVEKQTSLENVSLKGWPCDKHITTGWYDGQQKFNHLFSVLVSLFKQPQFREFELEATSVLFSNLKEILCTFFTAPSLNHQMLKLSSVTIFHDIKNPGAYLTPEFNEMVLKKSLHLGNMILTPSQEELVFKYPLLKMESLTLVNVTSATPSKALQQAADLLCTTENCQLKTLILKDVVLNHPNPQNVVSLLLQSPNLTYLELEHCDIGPGGLITSLTRNITSCDQLNVLKLVRSDLGGQSDEIFHQLCNAIFSLPRISNLSLDVSMNKLAVHHFTIVMDTWKGLSSGRKLKELIVSENDLEPGLLALANIAQNVVYIF